MRELRTEILELSAVVVLLERAPGSGRNDMQLPTPALALLDPLDRYVRQDLEQFGGPVAVVIIRRRFAESSATTGGDHERLHLIRSVRAHANLWDFRTWIHSRVMRIVATLRPGSRGRASYASTTARTALGARRDTTGNDF